MVEIISDGVKKARKDHKCDYCGEVIPKGTKYYWQKNIYDGTFYEWHEHEKCREVASAIWNYADPDEGMDEELFKNTLSEVCQCFICPYCEKWERDFGCVDEENYCIDKAYEFFKTHELYKDKKRSIYERWKCRERRENQCKNQIIHN